jgi:hypothetical protein
MARLYPIISLLLWASCVTAAPQLEFALQQRWLHDGNNNPVAHDYGVTTASLRMVHDADRDNWRWQAHYLLEGAYSAQWTGLAASNANTTAEPFWRLEDRISDGHEGLLRQRVDRLWLSHSSEAWVFKVGRQAITWGSGHLFRPMDLFNPFSATAIDTRYKPGLDMLYAQRLFLSGGDLQMLYVPRREPDSGHIAGTFSSAAAKWLGFSGSTQYEVLLAQDYGETVAGVSIARPVGEALLSADWVISETALNQWENTLVVGVDYSWSWGRYPVASYLEYFYNGFGAAPGTTLDQLPDALQQRIGRGQLFQINRDYLAMGLAVQLSPLSRINMLLLNNLNDSSRLAGVRWDYDLTQEVVLGVGLHLPGGGERTEYGGLQAMLNSNTLVRPPAEAYVRFAWEPDTTT